MNRLQKKWLGQSSSQGGFEIYHPRVIGFEHALACLRERSSDNVESVCHIKLPFAVQQHVFDKFNLSFEDGKVLIVYIELNAVLDEYALAKDIDGFEAVS